MILWFIFLIFGLCILKFRVNRRRLYELASLLPKPKAERHLIGIAHKFSGDMEDAMIELRKLIYESMKSNGILRAWLGHILYIVLTNPIDMEMVLKTCLEKDDLHRFLMNVFGNSVLLAPVNIWRTRRKIIVPAFSPKNLENFVEILSNHSKKLAKVLETKANEESFMMWPFLKSYTFDSVCEATMGTKTNTLNDENSEVLKSLNRLFQLMSERMFHLWLQPDWLYKLFPQYREHKECSKIVKSFVDEVIEKKRIEMLIGNKNEADHYTNKYRRLFLDMILTSGEQKGYSKVELREEIMGVMAAGMDTSAITIGNVLKLLAKYPEVQDNIYAELQHVFGESDRPLLKEDLIKLKYTERVVKETLRLFPPIAVIVRKVLEDITLPSGSVLPAGSGVVCSIFGVHRDPRYWGPNAEHFDPDRFLPERFNVAHACSFIPFGYGPRNCVGYQYSMMSVKTALAAILRHFRVVEDKEIGPIPFFKVKFNISMKAADDYQIALEKRKVSMNI